MTLTVRILGVEVLHLTTTPPPPEPPPGEGRGVHVTRHDGAFDLGFQPRKRWDHTWREDEGP